jgi:hypothetical protein
MSTRVVPFQTVIKGLANNSLQKSGVPIRSCPSDLSDTKALRVLQSHIASKPTENEIPLFYEYFTTLAQQCKHFGSLRR